MSPRERVALSEPIADEVRKTTCYMCACRCGINVHLKDGKIRYIEGNRDHPVNKGRAVRQGFGRNHAALCAGAAQCAADAHRAARLRRIPGDLVGRGAGIATDWLRTIRKDRSEETRLLHRPRPVAVADRLLGATVRHAELCGAWRLLLGQHGGRRASSPSAARSGNSARPTGTAPSYFVMFGVAEDHDSNPIKIGHLQAEAARRALRLGQSGAHWLFARSPITGSASAPAPMGCSSWRSCMNC